MTLIEDDAVVLFQGDSITDAGRGRGNDPSLGTGYPNMIAAWFNATHPEKNVRFLNRGISGNRVTDLEARWKADCLDLKPTWLSILIGINDVWRRYDSSDPTSVEEYEDGYRRILTRVKEDTANPRLIVLEPFVLPTPPDRMAWREDLDPKIQAARSLAREFDAIYVPLDGIFAAASVAQPPAFWAGDGVHPTQPGHALIARKWLEAVKAL
ncbi:MAG: SGNH/GDSL hydrolase family protein [Armatimonadetes bacterium]|nr:SGNH/GDSL hydrolase family protein [Armatimonadota bacterium]